MGCSRLCFGKGSNNTKRVLANLFNIDQPEAPRFSENRTCRKTEAQKIRLGRRHEPLSTVLLEPMSESIGDSSRAVGRPNQTPDLPSRTGPTQIQTSYRSALQ